LVPTNGTVSVTNGTLFGAEIYFGCDTGFRLNGNASSVCQDSGKWDAETPKCQLIGIDSCCQSPGHVFELLIMLPL